LLGKIRHNEEACHLSRVFAAIAFLFEDLIQMVLDTVTCPILRKNTLDVHGSSFEAFVIFVSTHILVERLKCNLGISPCFLNDPYR
jgi:hypothetical protein